MVECWDVMLFCGQSFKLRMTLCEQVSSVAGLKFSGSSSAIGGERQ